MTACKDSDAHKGHRTTKSIGWMDILPDVVFIDAQVLLDKITELVEHSLMLHSTQSPAAGSVGGLQKFKSCGITLEILSQFKSGYVLKLFEEEHLILLFKHLLIVAEVGEGEYLMSCLLEEEAIPHPLPDPSSCLLYTSPSPRDATLSRMPSSA